MPHNNSRLTEDIKREIGAALFELGDERLSGGFASVSRCEVTNDLSYCKVYISAHGGEEKTKEIVSVLQNASGFFKKRINARIKMRKLPELRFIADNSLDYYDRITNILTESKRNNENVADD